MTERVQLFDGDLVLRYNERTVWIYQMQEGKPVQVGTSWTINRKRTLHRRDTGDVVVAADFTPGKVRNGLGPYLVGCYFPELMGCRVYLGDYALEFQGNATNEKPEKAPRARPRIAKTPEEIWRKARETDREFKYIDVAECAVLVRAALKRRFPGVKFSVRLDRYAGGSSIDVYWTDGPEVGQVDQVIKVYEGSRFDGMIDLKYGVTCWLRQDGTATVAHNPGTQGSRGADPGYLTSPLAADAVEVHFGADYVFANRKTTVEASTDA